MESLKQLRLFLRVIKGKKKYKFKIQHKLVDVLTIILCDLLYGCEALNKINMYAIVKNFLRNILI